MVVRAWLSCQPHSSPAMTLEQVTHLPSASSPASVNEGNGSNPPYTVAEKIK